MWLGQRGTLLKLPHPKQRASRPTPPNTLRLLPPKRGAETAVLSPTTFLLRCFMLWDELRWCRCWIITPRRGIANTCRGVRERGFLGLKASMPRTEELSGRKYTTVWIRSAIISSRAGPSSAVNPCDVNEQWHDNDITHSYSPLSREVKRKETLVKNTRNPVDCSWWSRRRAVFAFKTGTASEVVCKSQKQNIGTDFSPGGNIINNFKRLKLTLRNHKIIKLSWRNEKELLYLAVVRGNKSPGPRFHMSRRRLRDLGSACVLCGAELVHASPRLSQWSFPYSWGILYHVSDDRMKDAAKGLAGTRLGKWMDGRPSSWQATGSPSELRWFAKHSKIERP